MNKIFKIGFIAVAALAAIFAGLLVLIAWKVDPNSFKPQIVQLVQEKKQRTLTLEGDIKLKLFPRLGLDLGKTQISEHKSPAVFASFDSVKLYVAWLPLLRKELVVDKVSLDGVQAKLVRNADGSTNFDDLMSKTESEDVKFDISGVVLTRGALRFEDKQAHRVLAIQDLKVHTGRLKDGVPTTVDVACKLSSDQPQANVQLALKSGLLFARDDQHYALDGLNAQVTGDALGMRQVNLSVRGGMDLQLKAFLLALKDWQTELSGQRGAEKFKLALAAPQLSLAQTHATASQFSIKADLESAQGPLSAQLSIPSLSSQEQKIRADQMVLELSGKRNGAQVSGKFSSPMSGNVHSQTVSLDKIAGELNMSGGTMKKPLHLQLGGAFNADLLQQRVATNLNARLDDSAVRAQLGMQNFAKPSFQFDVSIDQIDLDRYVAASGAAASGAGENSGAPAKEQPIDFSALKDLNANGQIHIGQLKFSNVKSSNVKLQFKAEQGKLQANAISANLYQGELRGAASVTASAAPQITLQQNLSGVSIGPLLRDLAQKDVVEGRGNVALQLHAQGASTRLLTSSLAGTAALSLQDGAIKGVNLGAIARQAKAALNMQAGGFAQNANSQEKTDFSELKANFVIRDGVAHNEDLSAKSPLLRVAGKGDIDLNRASMDYLVKATLVGSLEGQGGKDSAQLKGLTVPIRVAGAFSALHYSFDASAALADTAKAQVEQHKEVLQQKVQEQLQDRLKGLFGR